MIKTPSVKLLDTEVGRYWHVRWSPYNWLQWPAWREPREEDYGDGYISADYLRSAERAVQEENSMRELIVSLRGKPDKCFACERTVASGELSEDDLEPEEGGAWWCHSCIERWETKHGESWAAGRPFGRCE